MSEDIKLKPAKAGTDNTAKPAKASGDNVPRKRRAKSSMYVAVVKVDAGDGSKAEIHPLGTKSEADALKAFQALIEADPKRFDGLQFVLCKSIGTTKTIKVSTRTTIDFGK